MNSNRIDFVDTAKGLGILLVVWGHSSHILFNEIYAFHMPLFFFIAGFFLKPTTTLENFAIKKTKTLILPYIIFYTFTLLFYTVLLLLTNRACPISVETLIDYIPVDNEILNTPLWFFYALFWMSIIYFLLRKFIKNNTILLGVTILLYVINAILTMHKISLPMYLNRSLGEMIYMHLGYLCFNKYELKHYIKHSYVKKRVLLFTSFILFTILYNISAPTKELIIIGTRPLIAISGIMMVVVMSMIINSNKVLNYLGKHSLVIFALHLPLFEIARPIAKRIFEIDSIGYECSVFVISLLLSIGLGEIFMMIFPKYLGKRSLTNQKD